MTNGVIVWLIIFAVSAAGFFIIALVVSIKGLADLRVLLRHSGRRDGTAEFSGDERGNFPDENGRI